MSNTLSHLPGQRRGQWWADRQHGDLAPAWNLVLYTLRFPVDTGDGKPVPKRFRITTPLRYWPNDGARRGRRIVERNLREGSERSRVRMELRRALTATDRDDVDIMPTRHRNSVSWDWL